MSIQSEITRIIDKRDLSFEAVEAKGVAVPSNATINDLPNLISQIQSDEIFWATYGTTTSAQIETAYQAGKIVFMIVDVDDEDVVLQLSMRNASDHHTFTGVYGSDIVETVCDSDVWDSVSVYTMPQGYPSNPNPLGTASPGSSAHFSRGDHVHKMPSASDVGAIATPSNPSSGQFLQWNGSAWVAASLPLYNGGVS